MDKLRRSFGNSETERVEFDFYRTPPEATEKLLEAVKLKGPVWEPACGDGAISAVLVRRGYQVISTDLHDWGYGSAGYDFLGEGTRETFPYHSTIITNPPFGLQLEFCRQAIRLVPRVFMLLRLDFLTSRGRLEFLRSSPLRDVFVFSGRIGFRTPNSGSRVRKGVNYAWYYWERGWRGKPRITWL